MTLQELLDRFAQPRQSADEWEVRCPAHEDAKASLTIREGNDGRLLLCCHAGCTLDAILEQLGLATRDLFPANGHPPRSRSRGRIVQTYDYCDEHGTLLYQVCRFEPKDFRLRQADGSWSVKQIRRVVYRLPQLQGQPTVYVVEGEKDADRLWALHLPATTNAGGAGKWTHAYTAQLTAAGVHRVAIFPDNDAPGLTHAHEVAQSCLAAGLAVTLVRLPGLTPKGDVSDYLTTHSRDELAALVTETPAYTPPGDDASTTPAPTMDLASILTTVVTFLHAFVVLTTEQAHAVALFVVHTYAFKAAEATPYLSVTSAVKRSGKTRLLEVLALIVRQPWLTGRASAAVLFRKIDKERPTLLLDESDATFNQDSEYSEALRGVLNTGYRDGGQASCCIGQGANLTYKDFSTFCPKAIAGIGKLPDTVQDRAIPIILKRRTRDEPIQRLRVKLARAEVKPLRDALTAWASDATLDTLRTAQPALPDALNDRAQDVWEPLFAIAELAGGDWPTHARTAAATLAGTVDDDDIGVELLADIWKTLNPEDGAKVSEGIRTTALLEQLLALDERPWATWRHGEKPLTSRGLMRLLKPFGIHPDRLTDEGGRARGYRREAVADAVARYLPSQVSMCPATNKDGPKPAISMCPDTDHMDTCETAKNPIATGLRDTWTHRNAGTSAKPVTADEDDTWQSN